MNPLNDPRPIKGMNLPVPKVMALPAVAAMLLSATNPMRAAADPTNSPILANLSFEQLSQIQVVTVSQRSESASDAPAAVRVVTSEDVARSGATSIPEALRTVPGLNVAQINGSSWAIGARGFQSQYANKLLVMVDGVSVYSPVSAGVFWDQQNYLLADLQQMEVVLGPGGAIWGANAMNGVINIITTSARDTQGGLVYGGGGTEQAAQAGARYGWQTGTNTYARVYGIYSSDHPTELANGAAANDATISGQGGFRLDGYPRENTGWTLKGDVRWAQENNTFLEPDPSHPPILTNNAPDRVSGGQLMSHWQTELNPDSVLQLQAFYDYSERNQSSGDAGVQTADVELHHAWSGWRRQVIDWGLDGRMVYVDSAPSWAIFRPAQDTEWLGSGFVQDEISLVPDRLSLTGGIKLEEHSEGGFLPQPNVRLAWHPVAEQTFWAAWSQALRCPQEVELDSRQDVSVSPIPHTPYFAVIQYTGNPNVKPEALQAWELGWRWQARRQWSVDVDGYYYQYHDLIMSTNSAGNLQGTDEIIRSVAANGMHGAVYGGELAVTWQPGERWFASAGYSVLHVGLESSLPDPLLYARRNEATPHQTASLSSGVKLNPVLELTGALRYVDSISYYNIPGYVELDTQLTWQLNRHWQLAVAGQNLLQDRHAESVSSTSQSSEVPRAMYAKVAWRF